MKPDVRQQLFVSECMVKGCVMNDPRAEMFVSWALEVGAIELVPGGRKLKSGRMSPYFFNSGLFTDGKNSSRLLSDYTQRAVELNLPFDIIFGPAYKGITLAFGMALCLSQDHHRNSGWAYNRKEEKGHAEGGLLVGANMTDKLVMLVDDVMTTGKSCDEAVKTIKQSGGTLVGGVIAFDRQETTEHSSRSATQQFSFAHKVPIVAIATLEDLIVVLQRDSTKADILEEILIYKQKHGLSA